MGIEPMMEVLQTSALPLGYVAAPCKDWGFWRVWFGIESDCRPIAARRL